MAKITCDVSNCGNHAEGGCSCSSIGVTGGGSAQNTACTNFVEGSGASNSIFLNAVDSSGIVCGAHDCANNSQSMCNASTIFVSGEAANCVGDTQCSSYSPK